MKKMNQKTLSQKERAVQGKMKILLSLLCPPSELEHQLTVICYHGQGVGAIHLHLCQVRLHITEEAAAAAVEVAARIEE